jgi:integrase
MYKGDQNDWIILPPKGLGVTKTRYKDEELAKKTALLVAEAWEKKRQIRAIQGGKATLAGVVELFKRDQLKFMPWGEKARANNILKFNRIAREEGHRLIEDTNSAFISQWLTTQYDKANTYNAWLDRWQDLYRYALVQHIIAVDEAAKVPRRSGSLVIEANQKDRHELEVEWFLAIRDKAPPWLALAMDISLVTLQSAHEVLNLEHSDFRNGYVYIIREKVSHLSDAAFLAIKETGELREFKSRALLLDGVLSPFLVHRAGKNRSRDHDEIDDPNWHWSKVSVNYMGRAFKKALHAAQVCQHLEPEQEPTFHEIRGLGSRVCAEKLGMEKHSISILMAHADESTTDLYLKGGRKKKAVRDSAYTVVQAPWTLAQMTG